MNWDKGIDRRGEVGGAPLVTKNASKPLQPNPHISKTVATKNHFQNFANAKIPEIPGTQRYQPG
jgi:hypothetical protein